MVLSEGAQMTEEKLMTGFNGLQFEDRKMWYADIQSGAFKVILSED
jgi:hypothetical protein